SSSPMWPRPSLPVSRASCFVSSPILTRKLSNLKHAFPEFLTHQNIRVLLVALKTSYLCALCAFLPSALRGFSHLSATWSVCVALMDQPAVPSVPALG